MAELNEEQRECFTRDKTRKVMKEGKKRGGERRKNGRTK
jgi:hypothetical protein